MDRKVWGLVIGVFLISQALFINSVISYNQALNDNRNTFQTSIKERQERLLLEPIRGRMPYPYAYVFRDSAFYALMVNELDLPIDGNYTNLAYYLLKIQYSQGFQEIISTQKILLPFSTNSLFFGFAYDGQYFYTLQSLGVDDQNLPIQNVISFNELGVTNFNSTLPIASLPNLNDVNQYRREQIAASNGFIYVSELIYVNGIQGRAYEQIGKFSIPNLERVDTFTLPYAGFKYFNIDENSLLWLMYNTRPDKDVSGYNSADQTVSSTYFGYSLNSNIILNEMTLSKIVHLHNFLNPYSPYCDYQGFYCEYEYALSLIYSNELFRPHFEIVWNEANSSRFYFYAGFNMYLISKEYPQTHFFLWFLYLLPWLLLAYFGIKTYRHRKPVVNQPI